MLYYREISLKDQRKCLLKNAERADAAAFLHYFTQAHAGDRFSDNVCGRRDALGGGHGRTACRAKGEPHGD
ncbi:MAG: hypothetical protein ACLR0V_15800 [Roseburia hominis]